MLSYHDDKVSPFTPVVCEEQPEPLICLPFVGKLCGELAVTFTLSGIEIALDKAQAFILQRRANSA